MLRTKCLYKYVFTSQVKVLIILPLLPYPSWVYFCTDCKRGCFFQSGWQISFFWEFFCSDLREIFADFKALSLAPLLILKRWKVSSLRRKFLCSKICETDPKTGYYERTTFEGECKDHFLDSFVTQAEIEGFLVAFDGNLQRTYGRLL